MCLFAVVRVLFKLNTKLTISDSVEVVRKQLKAFNVEICNASQTKSLDNDIVLNYYSDAQGRIITAPVRQMCLFTVV